MITELSSREKIEEKLTEILVEMFELEPADGGCDLTLTTETTPEWADQSAEGWKMILESLAEALPGTPPPRSTGFGR